MEISPGKHHRVFGAGLFIVKGFFGRLASVFTITEQDRLDAGVHRKHTDY
jgi:hypothetical protein